MKNTQNVYYYLKEKATLTDIFCSMFWQPLLQIEMERTDHIFHTRIWGPVTST